MPSRGTTTERGYDHNHRKLREAYKPLVASGKAHCWRCVERGLPPEQSLIRPNEPWDLGHDDDDRTRYRGPEHQRCNRAAPHQATPPPPAGADTSRDW